MSVYRTYFSISVPAKGIYEICKTKPELDEKLNELIARCEDEERWRVDKPTISINVHHYSTSSLMTGRY